MKMDISLDPKLKEDQFSAWYDPRSWRHLTDQATVESWLGRSMICPACGRQHTITTRAITAASPLADCAADLIQALGFDGRALIVMDRRTEAAAGAALAEQLSRFHPAAFVFAEEHLHADENALGQLMMGLANRPDFLISCGSGTVTDITRYLSYVSEIPFIAVATAASVDGYASATTPLLHHGFKRTFPGVAPQAIFYDPQVLAQAPPAMTAAGFADVLAKVVALLDWRLAWHLEDEPYCPLIAGLVDRAVADCLSLAGDLAWLPDQVDSQTMDRRAKACDQLMSALSLTGIAMQMMGTSRPASGADHQISHLLEMRDVKNGRAASLHGDKVGLGTLISLSMYQSLFEERSLPAQHPILPAARWAQEVRRVYGQQAVTALAINEPEPPQGALWEAQKIRLDAAMNAFGYEVISSFAGLLPRAEALITAMGGPTRASQLGYTRQDLYDAVAFGKENRPKLTVLRLAERFGRLYDLAQDAADHWI